MLHEPVPQDVARVSSAGSGFMARLGRNVVLACTDIAAILASAGFAYLAWAGPVRGISFSLYAELGPLVGLFVLGYAHMGLYPGFGLGPTETLRRLSYVTAFGFLTLAAFTFALKLPHLYSRVSFAFALGLSLLLVPMGRVIVSALSRRWRWWSEPVVVVGTGHRAARAIQIILQNHHLGYRPGAILSVAPHPPTRAVEGVPVLGGLERARTLESQGFRVALLETDQAEDRAVVDRLQQHFRHVVVMRDYDDLPVEGLHVRNLGELVGIEYTNNLLLLGNRVAKRVMDVALAALALIAFAPVIAWAAILVRLIDGSPAFFFHERTGLGGRRVSVPKIRTMKLDAERRLEEYLVANPALRAEWQQRFKLMRDPRLIPLVGRILRRFSLDELPQLWAVVVGNMSLVGPRPLPDYHMSRFPLRFLELRQRVRPGITGLWQISVRSDGGLDEQQAYDTFYIRNWSVWLDLYVLSRTVGAVISGRGAY